MTVLIVTADNDVHADAVEKVLTDRGTRVRRLDIGEFPANAALAAYYEGSGVHGYLQPKGRQAVLLEEVTCGWYRRPSQFQLGDQVTDRRWASREARQGLGGVLACLPWLNDPADMARAEYKPFQLRMASRYGLRVPASVVTNVLSAARTLDRRHGPTVLKRLSAATADGMSAATQPVDQADLTGGGVWARISQTASLVQQRIDKAYDVRLTVVDDNLFPVRIDSVHLDWRTEIEEARYTPMPVSQIPYDVTAGLPALMAALRLRYAACDFAVDIDGRWWFLEVNPNGQWLWLEDAVGVPVVSSAIADALTAA